MMPLDPQAEDFLHKLRNSHAPPLHELSVADARALALPPQVPREPMGRIDNRTFPGPAGGIATRIYHPVWDAEDDPSRADAQRPVIVFFHGGGWVIGAIGSYDALCRRLCNASGCIVAAVDYRLAPEHKFPAAVEDCFAATERIAAHAGEIGGDPQRIVVAGDSAGGNLAAVVALLARDRGAPRIARQVLIYPITDFMPEFASYSRYGSGCFLETETVQWFWNHYLNDPSEAADVRASPLRAEDFSQLPPAIVLVAECDPLADEGLAYADRLEAANVPVERIVCEGQIHGFLRRLDLFDRADEACRQVGESLRRSLDVDADPSA